MANSVLGIVSIHRLRTGVTVQLYLSADNGLYQNVAGSSIVPDWTDENNQPTITPYITGVEKDDVTEKKWYNEKGVEITTDSVHVVDNTAGTLKFIASPVSTPYHNLTYTFKCKVSTGGTEQTIERSIMVMVNEGGENSYWGNINAPEGTVLGELISDGKTTEQKKITLTPTLWSGAKKVAESGYTVKWFKTAGKKKDDGTYEDLPIEEAVKDQYDFDGKTLIVYRDAVDGMAHFECHFFVSDNFVEAEGVQVADNADEYFISIAGDKNVYTGQKGWATLTAGVYKHGTNDLVSCDKWNAIVTDSIRMNEYPQSGYYTIVTENGKGVFQMNESNMYVPNTGENHTNDAWLKTDVEYEEGGETKTKDVAVANISDATPCDVTVQFIATI